jgi:cation transport ATPase
MDITIDVLFANALTVAVIYGIWRIKRDENDWRAQVFFLIPLSIIGLVAYSSMPDRAAPRTEGSQASHAEHSQLEEALLARRSP